MPPVDPNNQDTSMLTGSVDISKREGMFGISARFIMKALDNALT